MGRRGLTAGICLALCCLVASFAVSAESRCARGESDFCLVKVASGPDGREARAAGWTQWASGSRMRQGGAPVRAAYAAGSDEPEPSGDTSRIPLDAAAAPGIGAYSRLGYGTRMQLM